MKPRTRPVRNLWFRWGRYLGLEPETVARMLTGAGFIELSPDGEHYSETDKARAIPSPDYDREIIGFLKTTIKQGDLK